MYYRYLDLYGYKTNDTNRYTHYKKLDYNDKNQPFHTIIPVNIENYYSCDIGYQEKEI